MKKLYSLLLLLPIAQYSYAQETEWLISRVSSAVNDSQRVEYIFDFIQKYSESDPIPYLESAQNLLVNARSRGDAISEALALSMIGYSYRGLGNTEKSLEYNLMADDKAYETGNQMVSGMTHIILGNSYKDLGNYSKALELYLATAQIGLKINNIKLQSLGFHNLGEVYLAMNRLDSSLMYAQRDYELCVRTGFMDYIGYTLLTLGSVHGKLGNPVLATGFFDMAIRESKRKNSPKQLNWAYTAKAQYYSDVNTDSAIYYAREAIGAVQNTSYSNYGLKPSVLLLNYYRTRNPDSALKYSEIYRVANDSLYNARAVQQTQLLTFENRLKRQELAQKKRLDEERHWQNLQYSIIALGIILFIIIYLLLSRSIIINTKFIRVLGVIALLIVFEFINLLLHPFLGRVTHHSPMLMLLAMVGIAAILVPLHHKLEKWGMAKLVAKNIAIRLRAARKTIAELEQVS